MKSVWLAPVMFAFLLLAGCGGKPAQAPLNTVTVNTPVAIARTAPDELLAPLNPILPVFVPVSDPAATSALTPEGERLYRILLAQLLARNAAWREWALEP